MRGHFLAICILMATIAAGCKKSEYRSQDVYDVALQLWVNAHDPKGPKSQSDDFLARAKMEASAWSKFLKIKAPIFSDSLWFEKIIVTAMPDDIYANFESELRAQLAAASQTSPKKTTRNLAVIMIKDWSFLHRFYDKRYGFTRETQ